MYIQDIMQYNKFSTDKFFHGNEQVAVFLTEDSPQYYPQPYSTLNQRDFWKITSILSGQGVLVINGHRYPVFPGFVCLIHPQDLTTWELTEPLTLYNVLFQRSSVEKEIQQWVEKNGSSTVYDRSIQKNIKI